VYNLAKKKPTQAEIELQLSERRFILETLNTAATLLQVPIVTAAVWFYFSRSNPALGALNKAILAAELAPIVGDIRFPEGVLLGAAMESTEDLLKILEGYGLGSVAEWYAAAEDTAQDAGEMAADKIVSFVAPLESCETLKEKERLSKEGYKTTTGLEQVFWGTNLAFIRELLKQKKCVEYGAVKV